MLFTSASGVLPCSLATYCASADANTLGFRTLPGHVCSMPSADLALGPRRRLASTGAPPHVAAASGSDAAAFDSEPFHWRPDESLVPHSALTLGPRRPIHALSAGLELAIPADVAGHHGGP